MRKNRHTVSDIVASVYCEQKVVFDRSYGQEAPARVKGLAQAGTFEHLRFEVEGYTRNPLLLFGKVASQQRGRRMNPGDSRCFIASAVYGHDGESTHILRAWRDRVLLKSRVGRLAVRTYYALSPALLLVLVRSPALLGVVRRALDLLVSKIGSQR